MAEPTGRPQPWKAARWGSRYEVVMLFDTLEVDDSSLEPSADTRNTYAVAVVKPVMVWVMFPPAGVEEPIVADDHDVPPLLDFSTVYVHGSP